MNFVFSWQKRNRYNHSNIKFISSRQRVISSIWYNFDTELWALIDSKDFLVGLIPISLTRDIQCKEFIQGVASEIYLMKMYLN